MKVCIVIGTRPEIIKLAPLIKRFRGSTELTVVNSGQHYDWNMSSQFFGFIGLLEPDITLNAGSGSHGKQTATLLKSFERTFQMLKPDLVIVPTDTNTTLGAALASSKLNLPTAHAEDGARSFD